MGCVAKYSQTICSFKTTSFFLTTVNINAKEHKRLFPVLLVSGQTIIRCIIIIIVDNGCHKTEQIYL